VVVAREEGMGYGAARAVEGVAIIVVSLREVDLDVSGAACHLVEIQGRDVTPDLESIVHECSHCVPAQW
jgi:hypothetical protein